MSFFRKAFSVPNRHNKTAFNGFHFPWNSGLCPTASAKMAEDTSLHSILTYDASSSSCDRRAGLRLNRSALYFPCAFRYCSSLTFSSHSLEQFTPGASIEKCENQLSEAAPCQCLTPVGMFTQSPGYISTASLPHS